VRPIVFVTNADTELLALRAAWEDLEGEVELIARHIDQVGDVTALLEDAGAVVVRLLGGAEGSPRYPALRERARVAGVPFLAYPGERALDDQLLADCTLHPEVVREGFRYLVAGGPTNLASFLRLVANAVLGAQLEVVPVEEIPAHGRYRRFTVNDPRARVALIVYRAHLVAGNLLFADELGALAASMGVELTVYFAYSLRGEGPSVVDLLVEDAPEVVVTTVLAAGQAEGLEWDPGALARLEVPVVQAPIATTSQEEWRASAVGLRPLDVAMAVAIPEFDGRIVQAPIAFKEVIDEDEGFGAGIVAYRLDQERASRLLAYLCRLVRLRRRAPEERQVAMVLSAYPTKRSRLGNAVGLDTPASLVALAAAMREAGYRVEGVPEDPDELMGRLGDLIDYEHPAVRAGDGVRMPVASYLDWYAELPSAVREEVESRWGPPPGEVYLDGDALVFPALAFGSLLVAIQPPRGFGENPIAVYHSPELPPTHHYLAFYAFLERGFDADVVCHLGKHGTTEWLPGKSVGLGPECYPDVALGTLPVVYPFVINDPGEGTQAKRRIHAVLVGHLVPPMTRAETYGDLARLELLMDEHQRIAAMDPGKLPAIRAEIWRVIEEIRLDEDLRLREDPDPNDDAFDEFLLHVDGYLCELKDTLIRGGLHILGKAPEGEQLIDLVAAITRVPQLGVEALRPLVAEGASEDEAEARVHEILAGLAEVGFDPGTLEDAELLGSLGLAHPLEPRVQAVLAWISGTLVPSLRATSGEIDAVLRALAGRPLAPGPAGAPTRGMAHALPTGRNFYSVDPRALPTPMSWLTGERLAEALVARYRSEHEGAYPAHVGVVLWGTAAIRTGGDDVAMVLALIGVEPEWDPLTQRVRGLRLRSLAELGRPRVDVTCRISGFFRDAFPHAVELIDEAVGMVAKEAGEGDANPLARAPEARRIFGPAPRAYGSGILPLIETRAWQSVADLAEVYVTWGGYAYGRDLAGVPDQEGLRSRLAGIQVAMKAQDNREHDIFDSDDYLQDHGGMIAAARALGAGEVEGYFGDSSNPADPRVRGIDEESARVMRARVLNPRWIEGMMRHGYKGAFEMAATVDYVFGYDATAGVARDWMYDQLTDRFVGDPEVREFIERVNPTALVSICERLLEAAERGMWQASAERAAVLRRGIVAVEGDLEERG